MDDPFAHCAALVRGADRDRYIAALFAPADKRPALHALHAFNVEIARVREAAREPLAGEIRLQWWSDLLAGEARGDAGGNPVAAALLATRERCGLPDAPLQALIEARRFDLYDAPMATLADLESYGRGSASGLIALAGCLLAPGAEMTMLAEHAGLAYAITGLLAAFPVHAARGQVYVPVEVLHRHGAHRADAVSGQATARLRAALADLRAAARRHLETARGAFTSAPPEIVPALLPLALVPPMLARMELADYDPFVPVEIAPWRRQWRLWRAARKPERMFG